MDKIMDLELAFDSTQPSTVQSQSLNINPEKYQKFMALNPVWSFFNISRQDYLSLSQEARANFIEKYYKHMLNGKYVR